MSTEAQDVVVQSVAVCDWESDVRGHLSISKGEPLKVINKYEQGWILVENKGGQQGLIPAAFLRDDQTPSNVVLSPTDSTVAIPASHSTSIDQCTINDCNTSVESGSSSAVNGANAQILVSVDPTSSATDEDVAKTKAARGLTFEPSSGGVFSFSSNTTSIAQTLGLMTPTPPTSSFQSSHQRSRSFAVGSSYRQLTPAPPTTPSPIPNSSSPTPPPVLPTPPTSTISTASVTSCIPPYNARARRSFVGERAGELSFNEGDIVLILKHEMQGWLLGSINGKKGHVPSTFVVPITSSTSFFDKSDASSNTVQKSSIEKDASNVTKEIEPSAPIDSGPVEEKIKPSTNYPKSSTPSWLGQVVTSAEYARVLIPFSPSAPQMLPLIRGERILILCRHSSGWWLGECHSRIGFFPHTYVHGLSGDNPTMGKALYSYSAKDNSQLSLTKGEKIIIIEQLPTGWWRGESSSGKIGHFPGTYVRLLPPENVKNTVTIDPALFKKSMKPRRSLSIVQPAVHIAEPPLPLEQDLTHDRVENVVAPALLQSVAQIESDIQKAHKRFSTSTVQADQPVYSPHPPSTPPAPPTQPRIQPPPLLLVPPPLILPPPIPVTSAPALPMRPSATITLTKSEPFHHPVAPVESGINKTPIAHTTVEEVPKGVLPSDSSATEPSKSISETNYSEQINSCDAKSEIQTAETKHTSAEEVSQEINTVNRIEIPNSPEEQGTVICHDSKSSIVCKQTNSDTPGSPVSAQVHTETSVLNDIQTQLTTESTKSEYSQDVGEILIPPASSDSEGCPPSDTQNEDTKLDSQDRISSTSGDDMSSSAAQDPPENLVCLTSGNLQVPQNITSYSEELFASTSSSDNPTFNAGSRFPGGDTAASSTVASGIVTLSAAVGSISSFIFPRSATSTSLPSTVITLPSTASATSASLPSPVIAVSATTTTIPSNVLTLTPSIAFAGRITTPGTSTKPGSDKQLQETPQNQVPDEILVTKLNTLSTKQVESTHTVTDSNPTALKDTSVKPRSEQNTSRGFTERQTQDNTAPAEAVVQLIPQSATSRQPRPLGICARRPLPPPHGVRPLPKTVSPVTTNATPKSSFSGQMKKNNPSSVQQMEPSQVQTTTATLNTNDDATVELQVKPAVQHELTPFEHWISQKINEAHPVCAIVADISLVQRDISLLKKQSAEARFMAPSLGTSVLRPLDLKLQSVKKTSTLCYNHLTNAESTTTTVEHLLITEGKLTRETDAKITRLRNSLDILVSHCNN
ncbi:intersectin [Pelomyxa schiedti]|nr:intersectin [Pelomyxa schiedti]